MPNQTSKLEAQLERLREEAQNLLDVLVHDGGFTEDKEKDLESMLEEGEDDIGEPWTAMRRLRAALDTTEFKKVVPRKP